MLIIFTKSSESDNKLFRFVRLFTWHFRHCNYVNFYVECILPTFAPHKHFTGGCDSERGISITCQSTSYPSNMKTLTPSQPPPPPIHFEWLGLEWFGVWCQIYQKNHLHDACYFKAFYVGWMKSMFVVTILSLSRRWKQSEKFYNLLNLIILKYSRRCVVVGSSTIMICCNTYHLN